MPHLKQLDELCQPTPVADFIRLKRRLATHLIALEEQQVEYEDLDLTLARQITDRLTSLADDAGTFGSADRAWIRGAIDYFLITTDVDNDVISPTGLVDDAHVLNHTLERVGRPELMIEIASQ